MHRFFLLGFLLANLCFATPLKIGVLIPLSGPEAWWGEPMRNSILLAYEEMGLSQDEVKIVWEDWEGRWPKLASATQKLINVDKVDAIINTFDKAGYIVAPFAKKAQVPHLAMSLDDTIADGEYNFTIWTPVKQTTRLMLQKAYQDGYRKIALFVLKDYYPYRSELEINKQLKDFPGMEVVYSQQYDPSLRDFRTLSMKAYAHEWDLGILLGYPPSGDLFYKQLQADGNRTITSDATFDMVTDYDIIPNGAWWVGAAENTDAFNQAYAEKFGETTFTGVTYSYDCLKLVVEAWRKNPDNISSALKEVKIQGAGGLTTINKNGVGQMQGYLKWKQEDKTHRSTTVPADID